MNHLIVVVGPTAVGKTALSMILAENFDAEIISADSRQIFIEMNVGTAKPSAQELARVKHHFINSHSISQSYTAGMYEKDAMNLIQDLFNKRKYVIVTGGSGLYVKALTQGLEDIPEVDPKYREQLNIRLREHGLENLVEELRKVDKDYHQIVDIHNPHRVIRALEVFQATGKSITEYHSHTKKDRPFNIVKIGLNLPREELYKRIDQRMDLMIEAGLFEEAKELYDHKSHQALQTVGYKEIFDFIDGHYDHSETIRLLKRNSRRYAKRQMTWFNKDTEIKWYHPDQVEEIINYVGSVT